MLRIWISLVLVAVASVWATAAASAQDTNEMSITDDTLDASPPPANAYADIEAASIALVDEKTLRLTMQVAALPAQQPAVGYGVVFSDGKNEWYGAAVTVPHLVYFFGPWDGDSPGDSRETTGTFATGLHGVVTVDFPVRALGNATSIMAPSALVVDIKGDLLPLSAGFLVLDQAAGEGSLVLRRSSEGAAAEGIDAPADDAVAPAAVADAKEGDAANTSAIPAPGALAALAAVGLALVLRRSP